MKFIATDDCILYIYKRINLVWRTVTTSRLFFLIGIHSMQGWTATKGTKRLKLSFIPSLPNIGPTWRKITLVLCPFSTSMSTKNCVSSFIYVFGHTVGARCRKPLKTLLFILGSIHEIGLMYMFVIASFQCTLNLYFLLVVLLVMLMSKKSSECFWSSNSTVYFIAGSCLCSISKKNYLRVISLENVCGKFISLSTSW